VVTFKATFAEPHTQKVVQLYDGFFDCAFIVLLTFLYGSEDFKGKSALYLKYICIIENLLIKYCNGFIATAWLPLLNKCIN
jgi:hypothetical protein